MSAIESSTALWTTPSPHQPMASGSTVSAATGGPAAGDLGRYLTVVTGDRVLINLTELALPDRSASTDEPVGPGCVGAEGSPGFYEDGTP